MWGIITAKYAVIKMYIHRRGEWPDFWWDDASVLPVLAAVRHRQGRLLGRLESLGFGLQQEATLAAVSEEVIKTSEIEGEVLDQDEVRSSVARHMGMDVAGLVASDRVVDGVVEMTLDAARNFGEPLAVERLFAWHAALFPTARSGMRQISVGRWRTDESGPMQVVSGPIGREKIHFEAPTAALLDYEMARFVAWFDDNDLDSVLQAAVAHFWFVTIHPFDDGNGRIARAIADLALARGEKTSTRFYSMSAQIRAERKGYYDILERTQKGDLNITAWILWFLECLDGAFDRAESTLESVMAKAAFWNLHRDQALNARQLKVVNRLLDGFEGKLTTSKYKALAKTSADTALRDINDLVARGILVRGDASGRSTSYSILFPG